MHRTALAAACLLIPIGAVAQDVIGSIAATLDGEARTWQTLDGSGSDTSYNTYLDDFGGFQSASITGYVEGAPFNRDVLQIVVGFMGGDSTPIETTVLFVPERMSQMWANIDGEPILTIDSFDGTQIAGSLSGRLCFKDGMMAEPDPETCQTIEGTFDTVLPPAD